MILNIKIAHTNVTALCNGDIILMSNLIYITIYLLSYPDFACVVISIEWIRSLLAISAS